MTKSSRIMRHAELKEARACLGFVLAGLYEESVNGDQTAAERAHAILSDVPHGGAMIAFSRKELAVIFVAIHNGAEGILQPSSGYRHDEKQAFRDAANRIREAGNFKLPGY